MSDSDSQKSAAEAELLANQGNPNLSPLDGGRWRPVSPDELLRRNVDDSGDEDSRPVEPSVRLQRRQELEQKLKANPTDLEGFLELASIYRDEHRPIEAKRLLNQAIQIFPDDETLRFQLEEAILARSKQQLGEVTDLAARLNTPEADRELDRAKSDWACRRMDVCRARLQRDPSQTQLRLALAEAKYDAELFEDAYTDAGKLTGVDELTHQAHLIRAKCLLALGKDLPAMKELRAIALRRAVVAPLAMRIHCLNLLCELAEKQSLDATLQQYREHLRRAKEASAQQTPPGN